MPDIKELKRQLRAFFREKRNKGDSEQKRRADEIIIQRLFSSDEYRSVPLVLTYVSAGSEVDTVVLIKRALADGKTVACPRCDIESHTMGFFRISSMEDLVAGAYGIMEPTEHAVQVQPEEMQNSVCIVPGLSFDSNGGRLGYGGGYYDRFLTGYSGISMGLCREETFSVHALPQDKFDVTVDVVITDISEA